MPSWGELLQEMQRAADPNTGAINIDAIRLKYLTQLQALTGRSTVAYYTDYLSPGGGWQVQINLNDMQGLMEVFRGLSGPGLDLILHSPGGQAEATDRLVRYMRSKFDHVRVFVPLGAMSAATMWCMAADEIVMGKHSQLGPIDPQVGLPSGLTVPAGALVDQFKQASDECAVEPERVTAWLPTLQQYPPGLLNICESAATLARQLVADWLKAYMLRGQDAKADAIANWLADDKTHLSHSRAITRDDLVNQGLAVTSLEDDQNLQDAVLSVHHMMLHTLGIGSAVKIVENHLGRRFVQHGGQLIMAPAPQQVPQPQGPVPSQGPVSPQQPTQPPTSAI